MSLHRDRCREIEELIGTYGNADYDPLISRKDFRFYYHLSSLRHALLSWYDFGSRQSALEVSPGYGAMTGLYLDRFASVDAVELDSAMAASLRTRFRVSGLNVEETAFACYETGKRYDWIFLIDADREQCGDLREVFAKCRSLLSESGTVVFGFRNAAGIKYRSGAIDDLVTMPHRTENLFGKDEVLKEAHNHFSCVRCFYALPDHLFTQAVFSDESLPAGSVRDRMFCIDPFGGMSGKDLNREYDRVVTENTLPENSDFVLMFLSDSIPEVRPVQAVLSADRGDSGYRTVFLNDGTVAKSAYTAAGTEKLMDEHRNLEKLKEKGLSVVSEQVDGKTLRMPRIRDRSLLEEIEGRFRAGDRDGITGLFREIYDNILRSSETDDSGYETGVWRLLREEAGVILRTGYVDMIPYNAFYDGKEIVYYDQEFTREYCPALYIMYRAVNYTYIHIPKLNELIPREEMMRLFGLTEGMQRSFQDVENRFVGRNRNWELYRQIYGWAADAAGRLNGENGEKGTEQ